MSSRLLCFSRSLRKALREQAAMGLANILEDSPESVAKARDLAWVGECEELMRACSC